MKKLKNIPTYYDSKGTPIYRDTTALPFNNGGRIDNIGEKILKRYPGMQTVYGAAGENLNVIQDPNYNASNYGYGNIEFIFPGSGTVYYTDDYTYQSPTPDKYTAVFNPKGANKHDVFLDMTHGMRNDLEYMKLLNKFAEESRKARGASMDKWYNYDAENNPDAIIDGREAWDNNYIDGLLRAHLAKKGMGRRSFGAKDYRKERKGSSPEMYEAADNIYSYLKGNKLLDGGPLVDKTNHGDLLPSVYASALGNYYAQGGMIKRADGSYSPRGLWDNIRAAAAKNKAAGKPGKEPSTEILSQAKKIEAEEKQMGGYLYGKGGQFLTPYSLPEDSFKQGGNNLHNSVYASSMAQYPAVYKYGGSFDMPRQQMYMPLDNVERYGGYQQNAKTFFAGGENHKVYMKTSPTGNGEGVQGHIMVNHPTKDKGQWDTIDLTTKAGAKTVTQGVAATKQWHAEHPNNYREGGSVFYATNTPQLEGEKKDLTYPNRAYVYNNGGVIKTSHLFNKGGNIENGIYTFAGRPGSQYKYQNGNWFISNAGTKNQYIPINDPTGNRVKTLEAGLQSGQTVYTQPLAPQSGPMTSNALLDAKVTAKLAKEKAAKDKQIGMPKALASDNTANMANAMEITAKENAPIAKQMLEEQAKEQAAFERAKWKDYEKMDLGNQMGDRAKAFMVDPLGMASRFLLGEQAYIPGMGDALVNQEDPNRDKYLKAIGYTPGKFEASDIQNMINPMYWGASIGSNMKRGNYGTAATEAALTFAPFFPKGSENLVKQGAGMLADDFVKAGNYLTTQTPLRNAYKVNPFAFKPQEGMMYRGLGQEGYADAIQSGVFRPKQYTYPEEMSFAEIANAPKQFDNTFYAPAEKFGIVQNYGPKYLAEVPFEGNQFGRRYKGKNWSWSTPREIPIDEGRILQKDWLRGYKEVPVESSNASKSIMPSINTPYIDEIIGSFKNKNRTAQLREAEDWVNSWVQHPATQEKILDSYKKALEGKRLTTTEKHNLGEIIGYSGKYNAQNRLGEYPLLGQDPGRRNIHSDNVGVSYTHYELPGEILPEPTNTLNTSKNFKELSPMELENIEIQTHPKYGNWISRKLGKEDRISTGVHELSHDWVKDYTLKNTDLGKELTKGLDDFRIQEIIDKYKGTELENKVLEELKYYEDPTELFARLMETRRHFNLDPGQKVTPNQVSEYLDLISAKKTPINHVFGKIISRGKKGADFFNNPWAWTGIAASGTQATNSLLEDYNNKKQLKNGGQVSVIKSSQLIR